MADDSSKGKKNPLDLPLLKGFVAGVIFSHLSRRLIAGLLVGTISGIYIQQNYVDIPNIETTIKDWIESFQESMNNKKR